MSSSTRAAPVTAGPTLAPARSNETRLRTRRRALMVTAGITVGEEIWGPVTAIAGTAVGVLSLAYLTMGGRSRVARIVRYALWAVVAFFGFGGYNDHRLPRPVDTITDQRERPPLAPLAFTGIAIAGAVALRSGSKGE
jgi:hypothetical protein